MRERVYLDWNATAPLRPEAREAMISAMDIVGNPSSVHGEGRAAKGLVERARAQVAAAFGADGADIIFTSGATEAAALALAGRHWASENYPSPVEHDCVFAHYQCGDAGTDGPGLMEEWFFHPDGSLQPMFDQGLAEVGIEHGKILSVTAANSETGVRNDTLSFSAEQMGTHHRLFVDAVQAFGKVPFAFNWSGADMAILSGHKIGGPKGVGALVVKRGTHVEALLKGGGQEMGRRSGTENVVGIAGFGAACEAAQRDLEAGVWAEVEKLRNILESTLASATNDTIFVGKRAQRLPNTSCIVTPGWKGETQVMQMDLAGFAVSSGSACSSGKVKASRVLRAMGFDEEAAASAIRVSLGPTTTEDDVLRFAEAWLKQEQKFRRKAA